MKQFSLSLKNLSVLQSSVLAITEEILIFRNTR